MTPANGDNSVAVVLAAHGDRGGGFTNAALLAHRDALSSAGAFASVSAGVLKGDPELESALAQAAASGASRIAVYPFFMADGFFVRKRLTDRLNEATLQLPWQMLPPLGIDPDLPGLMIAHALACASSAGIDAAETSLLVVGHGSKFGPASADATRAAAARVEAQAMFAGVATAFLEEPPSIQDALKAMSGPVIVSGFFSGDGMHAGDDVPKAIEESGVNAIYAGPIGGQRSVSELIAKRCAAAE